MLKMGYIQIAIIWSLGGAFFSIIYKYYKEKNKGKKKIKNNINIWFQNLLPDVYVILYIYNHFLIKININEFICTYNL